MWHYNLLAKFYFKIKLNSTSCFSGHTKYKNIFSIFCKMWFFGNICQTSLPLFSCCLLINQTATKIEIIYVSPISLFVYVDSKNATEKSFINSAQLRLSPRSGRHKRTENA